MLLSIFCIHPTHVVNSRGSSCVENMVIKIFMSFLIIFAKFQEKDWFFSTFVMAILHLRLVDLQHKASDMLFMLCNCLRGHVILVLNCIYEKTQKSLKRKLQLYNQWQSMKNGGYCELA
ncbi:hypothetical protein T06_8554 [Trichinella sp. T6]|nr:hypothetical protein T06_8554 [Trichinella sp. T6]